MRTLRLLLAFAFVLYAHNVPELLHAMDPHVHTHAHAEEHGHQHDAAPVPHDADAPDLSHLQCLSCVHGVQVLDQAPVLVPAFNRSTAQFVPSQFVPPQPCISIFHPPA
jgi:hypothetical protein